MRAKCSKEYEIPRTSLRCVRIPRANPLLGGDRRLAEMRKLQTLVAVPWSPSGNSHESSAVTISDRPPSQPYMWSQPSKFRCGESEGWQQWSAGRKATESEASDILTLRKQPAIISERKSGNLHRMQLGLNPESASPILQPGKLGFMNCH